MKFFLFHKHSFSTHESVRSNTSQREALMVLCLLRRIIHESLSFLRMLNLSFPEVSLHTWLAKNLLLGQLNLCSLLNSSDKIIEVGQVIGLLNLRFNEHKKYKTDNFGRFHCNT